MITADKVKNQIQSLINTANEKTGKEDVDLTSAVGSLVDGFGGSVAKPEQEKSVTITENGVTEVLPDDGKVLSKVSVNVEVESGGGLTLEGVVTGTEPAGDVVLGAITPKQQALIRCTKITSLTLNGTNFVSGNSQPFSYLVGTTKFTLKNTTGAMPSLALAYASSGRECKIIGSCAALSSNCFTGFGSNHSNGEPNIYVPWAEDEVAGAPWGAVKATIHYNTVYDENDNPII